MDQFERHFLLKIAKRSIRLPVTSDLRYVINDLWFAMFDQTDTELILSAVKARFDEHFSEIENKEDDQNYTDADMSIKSLQRRRHIVMEFGREFQSLTQANYFPMDVESIIQPIFQKKIEATSDYRDSFYHKKLTEITEVFDLDQTSQDILFLFFLLEANETARYGLSSLEFPYFPKSTHYLSVALDATTDEIRMALRDKSKLITSNIFQKSPSGGSVYLNLNSAAYSYIAGISSGSIHEDLFKSDQLNNTLPLEKFFVEDTRLKVIEKYLNSDGPVNLLLYGKPGTGKTEFARSVCSHYKKNAFFLGVSDDANVENLNFRKLALYAAAKNMKLDSDVLIIDECDRLLSSYTDHYGDSVDFNKAWINDFIESSNIKAIWITNDLSDVRESTLRRFSFSLEFRDMSFKQRRSVLKSQLDFNQIDCLDEQDIAQLAADHSVNAGAIALALSDLSQTLPNLSNDKAQFIQMFRAVLQQHEQLLYGKKHLFFEPRNDYSLEGLNTNVNLKQITEYVQRYYDYSDGKPIQDLEVFNLNILLYGPPGTGKTEFVKFLADQLHKKVEIRRSSDILSKWVGETERNIREIFEYVSENDYILFIDEADSLFIARDGANASWEVSQTNELLAQMENYRGVFICATNLHDNMDHAVMRRFNFKVQFDFLDATGLEAFYRRYFENFNDSQISADNIKDLCRLERVTPGDVSIVYKRNFFNRDLDHGAIVDQIREEIRLKSGPVIGLGRT